MIDTKTTTAGLVPNYTAMLAQNAQLIATLANLQSSPPVNEKAGKAQARVVVNYWRQWIYYCVKCGVNLKHNSINCKWKEEGYKDNVTSTDKKGGLAKKDHLWQLWCEPITNNVHKVLQPGAKTTA